MDEISQLQHWLEGAWLQTHDQALEGVLSPGLPISMRMDGKLLDLGAWARTHDAKELRGRTLHTLTWKDPAGALEICCELTVFSAFPAAEWVLRVRNTAAKDSALLEDILPLDLRLRVPDNGPCTLHSLHGSNCKPTDFLPLAHALPTGTALQCAPVGGRSSDSAFPFFNLAWPGGGLVGAIGWSGQWMLRARRDPDQPLRLQAGQELTRLRLHPGESIRTPRILLLSWQGSEVMRGHQLLRRLLLEHYVPRDEHGEVQLPPLTANTWFTFKEGNQVTEANQLEQINAMAALGVDAFWLDAGWFEGGWPNGAGSWVPKADAFPRGLKVLSDAAHAKGLRFVLWVEPERVSPGSRIAREHPEWVLAHESRPAWGALFNLGHPEAREWMTQLLSNAISQWGVDIYRQDFNIDPLRFWRQADGPERQGISEIRYVEGFYALWDELRRRHPKLAIDNCASGGRRIDLETISRSYPLWRSDTTCSGKAEPLLDQVQSAGLSHFVPLHAAGLWSLDPYTARSVATTGTSLCMDTAAAEFDKSAAKACLAEIRSLSALWTGDFHPLSALTLDGADWCAWQLDQPALGAGFAVFFRRGQSVDSAKNFSLRALDPAAKYRVTFVDTGAVRDMSGAQLAALRIETTAAPQSRLLKYQKVSSAESEG